MQSKCQAFFIIMLDGTSLAAFQSVVLFRLTTLFLVTLRLNVALVLAPVANLCGLWCSFLGFLDHRICMRMRIQLKIRLLVVRVFVSTDFMHLFLELFFVTISISRGTGSVWLSGACNEGTSLFSFQSEKEFLCVFLIPVYLMGTFLKFSIAEAIDESRPHVCVHQVGGGLGLALGDDHELPPGESRNDGICKWCSVVVESLEFSNGCDSCSIHSCVWVFCGPGGHAQDVVGSETRADSGSVVRNMFVVLLLGEFRPVDGIPISLCEVVVFLEELFKRWEEGGDPFELGRREQVDLVLEPGGGVEPEGGGDDSESVWISPTASGPASLQLLDEVLGVEGSGIGIFVIWVHAIPAIEDEGSLDIDICVLCHVDWKAWCF